MKRIQESAVSIMNIPDHILVDVLLKLPVKEVVICKCVCKTWLRLVCDPHFGKLYFPHSQILIRPSSYTRVSRMLHLVDPSKISFKDNSSDCICTDSEYNIRCPYHIIMKLDTKLKMPLDNFETLKSTGDVHSQSSGKRKHCIKYEKAYHHRFDIVNSCNGFLCLSKFYHHPQVVCNPMTGEFIHLPVAKEGDCSTINCGLGFSAKDNQYKVLRIFDQPHPFIVCCLPGGTEINTMRLTEIHTLGTNSWKSLGTIHAPIMSSYPIYLNGALHWYYPVCDHSYFILSFDFDTEQFQKILSPECFHNGNYMKRSLNLAVFRGCISLFEEKNPGFLRVWYMKEFGIQDSWTEEVIHSEYISKWSGNIYHPINYSNNGEILLVDYDRNALIFFDPQKPTSKYAWIKWIKSDFQVIAYTPNFNSLKSMVMGNPAVVKSIISRCAEFKVWGEGPSLSLVQEDCCEFPESGDRNRR